LNYYDRKKGKIMIICVPAAASEKEMLYPDFGSASVLLCFDENSKLLSETDCRACDTVLTAAGLAPDACIAMWAGSRVLSILKQAGIKIYSAGSTGILENIKLCTENKLTEILADEKPFKNTCY
jgi:predicted Fe-Mo cluster-binding NifX family protein